MHRDVVGLSRASSSSGDPYDATAVRRLVKDAMAQAGLGRIDVSRPMADLVKPGEHVLLKPNWVLHYNQLQGGSLTELVTHPEVVLAALAEVAAAHPGRVTIGDAPVQGCEFERVCTRAFQQRAVAIGRASNVEVEFVDFRRTRIHDHDLVRNVRRDERPLQQFVMFDLGADSMLEPITKPGAFRVTMYDPDKLAVEHRNGRHRYLIAREAIEADVVLSLPKLKTHRKAGVTAALKNLVGINGDKDFLPHHRVGGSEAGGDCYRGGSRLKRLAETLLDASNRRIGHVSQRYLRHAAYRVLRMHRGNREIEGGWSGNDTVWRTTLDLNRILLYGRADGTMADAPQRRLWSLTDCIIAGQGEGPLAPQPLRLDVVTFSGNAAAAEATHCALLRVDPMKIPLTREAFGQFRWPLVEGRDFSVMYDGAELTLSDVALQFGANALPALGWRGEIEDFVVRNAAAA